MCLREELLWTGMLKFCVDLVDAILDAKYVRLPKSEGRSYESGPGKAIFPLS